MTLQALLQQKNRRYAEMLAKLVLIDIYDETEYNDELTDSTDESASNLSGYLSDDGSEIGDEFDELNEFDELVGTHATSARTKHGKTDRYDRRNRPTQGIIKPRTGTVAAAASAQSKRYIGALVGAIESSQNSGTIADFSAAGTGTGAVTAVTATAAATTGDGRAVIKIPRSVFDK